MITNQSDNESSTNALKKISLISSNVDTQSNDLNNNTTTTVNRNGYTSKLHAKQKKQNKKKLKPLKSVFFVY
jgi:hypothetical protein